MTKAVRPPRTLHALITDDFAFLTRRVRIPRRDILAVKPTADGAGAIVVTRRGAMTVCEDYDALLRLLYGIEPRIGDLLDANA